MPMDTGILGVSGDCCVCGRKQSVPHCPKCGSMRLYAYAGYAVCPDLNDPLVEVSAKGVFRCTKCNNRFTKYHMEKCSAPPPKQKNTQQIVREAFGLDYDPDVQSQNISSQEVQEAFSQDIKTDPSIPEEQKADAVDARVRRNYTLEWVNLKMQGRAPTKTAEEYIQRRNNGEVFA